MNEEEVQEVLERAKRLRPHRAADPRRTRLDWLTEARYAAMRQALKRRGRHVEAVVIAVTVHCISPRSGQMRPLRAGLDAILDVKQPSRDDVPESVRREVS